MAKSDVISSTESQRDANLCSGAVVSDLHLFTNRTTVHEHIDALHVAATECNIFIFNGDVFDFKWSVHKGFNESVRAAEDWIRRIVTDHQDTRFVFILGNHDCQPAYIQMLKQLSEQVQNLEWRPVWFQLGSRLFLHGDMCRTDGSHDALETYRHRCNRKLRKNSFLQICYWLLAASGIPSVFLRFLSRKKAADGIITYISQEKSLDLSKISDVYFGHVHTPFSDFSYDGFMFHNTGAAIKGLRLCIIRFEY